MIATMSKPNEDVAAQKPAGETKPTEANEKAKIDIASLDLRLEKVEERISPSETNVFDK
jgi:hypothetical protein